MERQRFHYVYYSYESWGRGYIGVRSCYVKPESDKKYLGSFKDKSFKPTEKIILCKFETRKEAEQAEIKLHQFFQVAANPDFANRINSSTEGFNRLGAKNSLFVRQKVSESNKNNKYCVGRRLSNQTKQLISENNKGKHNGEKNPMFGKTHTDEIKDFLRENTKKWIEEKGHPMKGKQHTEESRRKISEQQKKIKVKLQNIETGEVYEFSSQLDAARTLGIYQGSVSSLCKGKLKTTGGWKLAV